MRRNNVYYHVVFPAHAGMSPALVELIEVAQGFPRSRGDEPAAAALVTIALLFSPLTRG